MSLLPVATPDQQSAQLLVDLQQIYTLFDTCINDGTTNAITHDKLHHMLLQYTGVNYNHEQITDIISSIDTNVSGDIQFTEFLVAMNKILKHDKTRPATAIGTALRPKTAKQQPDYNTTDLLHNVFTTIDSDNDGYIDINDMNLLYENNGIQMKDSEIAAITYMCDVNGHGKISYAAFEKLMTGETQ